MPILSKYKCRALLNVFQLVTKPRPLSSPSFGCTGNHEGPARRYECICWLGSVTIYKNGGGVQALGGEPWVREALGRRGPPFRHQVQHGQQEAAERVSLLLGPLVLLHQDFEQAPRLQLGDVSQVTWEKHVS